MEKNSNACGRGTGPRDTDQAKGKVVLFAPTAPVSAHRTVFGGGSCFLILILIVILLHLSEARPGLRLRLRLGGTTQKVKCAPPVGPFHLGVVLISTNFVIIGMSPGEFAGKRIPRPSAYGRASENIFLIAAGIELAIARS